MTINEPQSGRLQPTPRRTRVGRARGCVAAVAVTLASVSGLSACGSDESTDEPPTEAQSTEPATTAESIVDPVWLAFEEWSDATPAEQADACATIERYAGSDDIWEPGTAFAARVAAVETAVDAGAEQQLFRWLRSPAQVASDCGR